METPLGTDPAGLSNVPVFVPVSAAPTARSIDRVPNEDEKSIAQRPNKRETEAWSPTGNIELPPKPKDARFQSLDIFRGAACLMLMLYHAAFYAEHSWRSDDPSTWTLGGLAINVVHRCWMGVPMFFVVSGYCIAASIDSLRRRPHSLSSYFYRRFRRIYPPLWAACLLVVVLTLFVGQHHQLFEACLQLPRLAEFSKWDWVGNTTASTSWLSKLIGSEPRYLMPNTWTLCYEEQFYAVTGVLLIIASRRFFLAAYALTFLTILARELCRFGEVPIQGFFFDGHWIMFSAGILLYQHLNYLKAWSRWGASFAWLSGIGYGVAERLFASNPDHRHMGEYIAVACAFAFGLVAIRRWDRQIVSHRIMSPLLWCGKISYSIYLTHYPLTVLIACVLALGGIRQDSHAFLITIPVCILLSIPVAWLFHISIERHFINK